ncbi:MAG: tRNA (adenosine(37)-N6)-threonylcarbamoyltransferase complex ATPase subunit type 1 TsaE [Muribaculaceae bacterium]|nr:tRNA (adenosine(37)-N6)-threonylcarbamoyltransferase complex ATPase subunit type 1 TsaE [Muribaculaceae bacterium]
MEYIFSLDNLPEVAHAFIEAMGDNRIFAFEGGMGAGKTTFITEVCRQLGASDDSGSPTFSIVNEYRGADGSPIYHFDFYRLESPAEALDMGAEDYFYSGCLCLMEWPDRIGNLLPDETVTVSIEELPDGKRILRCDGGN